jgi:predicted dehydrogenase
MLKVVGINFDHMHMGDLLRQAKANAQLRIVGVSDEQPARVMPVLDQLALPQSLFEPDYRKLLERENPDLVILCPATALHADWTEKVAPYNVHILMEKPFAASLAHADRMIAAQAKTGRRLIINWPLRWYPSHVTAKRLVGEGLIGPLLQVHYYDGNRGPLRHVADKVTVPEAIANSEKAKSWWYKASAGGGSLLDYLGYGTTLGTWFMDGLAPLEVTAMTDTPQGIEVDEHSITICRYPIPNSGLSKFETRWGAFTDPWTHQPQPKCGFVLVGRNGTIASYDYAPTVRIQTRDNEAGYDLPVDTLTPPHDNPLNYITHCLTTGTPIEGPLSPSIARTGQRIVDSAALSAKEKRTVTLL